MTTVFIAGSIKIKHLDRKFRERIDKIIASGFDVVVGDADGADTAIQPPCSSKAAATPRPWCKEAAAGRGRETMSGSGRSTASPPILPPVYAPTSPRKTWPWPKRRTTD